MKELFSFAKSSVNDSSLSKHENIIFKLRKDESLYLTSLFIDRCKAKSINSALSSKHAFVRLNGVVKCWSLCFEEVANNPELRLALDKLDKESV